MLHRSTLDKASKPGTRFQGWKALPLGSKLSLDHKSRRQLYSV